MVNLKPGRAERWDISTVLLTIPTGRLRWHWKPARRSGPFPLGANHVPALCVGPQQLSSWKERPRAECGDCRRYLLSAPQCSSGGTEKPPRLAQLQSGGSDGEGLLWQAFVQRASHARWKCRSLRE